LWLCGSSGDGKLAGLSKIDLLEPKELDFFSGHEIKHLTCGLDHVIVNTGIVERREMTEESEKEKGVREIFG
jgi:hypothetical protein